MGRRVWEWEKDVDGKGRKGVGGGCGWEGQGREWEEDVDGKGTKGVGGGCE